MRSVHTAFYELWKSAENSEKNPEFCGITCYTDLTIPSRIESINLMQSEPAEMKKVPARTRVSLIAEELRSDIGAGRFRPGDRLPSEAELTRQHSVSRTVVREAIALLRSDGLVEARKGSGVFVLEPGEHRGRRPFANLDMDRLSGVIELFELRSGFEICSAGLAAARRSAEQIDDILKAHEAVSHRLESGDSVRPADFEFHYMIAQATQNKRFPEFLSLIRPGIVPRVELEADAGLPHTDVPSPTLIEEHQRIVDAIIDGDATQAEQAMKVHLDGSLARYRALLKAHRNR